MRGWGMTKGPLRRLFALELILAGSISGQGPGRPYRNTDYGYWVAVPEGLTLITAQAPLPNHGFRIDLSPTDSLWADGPSTDALSLDDAVAAERALWSRCKQRRPRPRTLDGAEAMQITMSCPAETSGGGPTTTTILIAYGGAPHRGPIRYIVGMQYRPGTACEARARRVFDELRTGFHFIREQ